MITLFGIKNCDTVKKAVSWLKEHNLDYDFFDVKSCGLTLKQIDAWRTALGAEVLLNKRSTTWKQLTPQEQAKVMHPQGLALILANPTLIKRPLIEIDGAVHVGFSDEQYAALFH